MESQPSLIEKLNQGVRGGCLSLMTACFCWKFVDGTVSTDAFISIFAGVLGWWFATRGQSTPTTPPNGTAVVLTATPVVKP